MAVESDGDTEPLMWAESGVKPERSAEIIKQINAKNAKLVALALVIGFILYHGTVHLRYGSDSCKWLLSDGRYKGDMEWQPYGCMMHKYTQTDTRRCMRYLAFWGRHNHFVFIGDSRIRNQYQAFLNHLTGHTPQPLSTGSGYHENQTFHDTQLKLTVDFIWSPYVSDVMVDMFKTWMNSDAVPSVIIAGCATWSIKNSNASENAVKEYAYNLTQLVESITAISWKKGQVLWVLQEPVNDENLNAKRAAVTNKQIDLYNKAAIEVLQHSATKMWSSSRLLAQNYLNEMKDGIHLGQTPLRHDTQILLNAYCNDHMNFNDGTCCSSAEPYTTLQVITFSAFGVCAVLAVAMALKHMYIRRFKELPSPFYTLITSLAKLGLIMAYFYLCDRRFSRCFKFSCDTEEEETAPRNVSVTNKTNFFMKENKYYSPVSFWLPFGYVFALGLFFTEDSRYTKVLHRDQTDEWKGWMQLVILIYHMTGASINLHIYNHVRMLVSAYLFLTGYGHFYYLWHRSDAGIVRFFQVMFRLNMMAVTLCFCMNRPYQFYYFVPLVSFWFMLVYLVLVTPPRVTAASSDSNPLQYLYLILKLVGLFSLIIMLYMSEVFFEKVFVMRPWKALFVTTDDDIHDWWFRWKLDRYSTSYGVVFGMALLIAQRYNLVDDNNHSNLLSPRIALCVVFMAFVGIGCSTAFALLCRNKMECNEVHSYTAFVPIVSYIILRNISGILRTRYSSFFAWFGHISLELFISQYHIWLAADTHGVLVLLPGYPVLNALITCFIFVCASHEIHSLTTILMPYVVPNDWRLVLRNVAVFIMILIPIGIHDGMF